MTIDAYVVVIKMKLIWFVYMLEIYIMLVMNKNMGIVYYTTSHNHLYCSGMVEHVQDWDECHLFAIHNALKVKQKVNNSLKTHSALSRYTHRVLTEVKNRKCILKHYTNH